MKGAISTDALTWIAIFLIVVTASILLLTGKITKWIESKRRQIKEFEYPPAGYSYPDEESCRESCKRADYLCKKIDYEWRCIKKCKPASDECKEKGGEKCCIDECPQGYEQIMAACPENRVCCKTK